jgi:hypothetical protein
MGRDGRYDRSAFAHAPPLHLNYASSPLAPPLPAHPPSGPQSGTEFFTDRSQPRSIRHNGAETVV